MLGLIGSYKFEINGTNFEKLKRSFSFNFAVHSRLKNFKSYQDIGEYDESISIEGVLIVKKQDQLKDFENMAKKKLPQTMVLGDGTATTILILNLDRDIENFLKEGLFLKQGYKINIAVVGDKKQ